MYYSSDDSFIYLFNPIRHFYKKSYKVNEIHYDIIFNQENYSMLENLTSQPYDWRANLRTSSTIVWRNVTIIVNVSLILFHYLNNLKVVN